MSSLPNTTKSIILKKSASADKPVYHGTSLETRPIPALKQGEVLVKMTAVAYNRRDLWIRLGQYPGIKFDSVLGADGVGMPSDITYG